MLKKVRSNIKLNFFYFSSLFFFSQMKPALFTLIFYGFGVFFLCLFYFYQQAKYILELNKNVKNFESDATQQVLPLQSPRANDALVHN